MPSLTYTPSYQGYSPDPVAEDAEAAAEEETSEDQNSTAVLNARLDAAESKISGIEAQVAMLFTNF